jgi:hypothetical protein
LSVTSGNDLKVPWCKGSGCSTVGDTSCQSRPSTSQRKRLCAHKTAAALDGRFHSLSSRLQVHLRGDSARFATQPNEWRRPEKRRQMEFSSRGQEPHFSCKGRQIIAVLRMVLAFRECVEGRIPAIVRAGGASLRTRSRQGFRSDRNPRPRRGLPTVRAELRMRTRVSHNGCSGLMAGTDLSEQSRGTLIDSRFCFSSLRAQSVLCLGKFTLHGARPWDRLTARVVPESTSRLDPASP